jgi:hypothetical protein
MKKTDFKPVRVYQNTEHEETTKQQLEQAKQVLQRLLNLWNDLNIGSCSDLNELLMRPERSYKNAIDKLVEVPAPSGRFPVKRSALLAQLDLPDPEQLYASAKVSRQVPFCASGELWQVIENSVELVEAEAFMIIDSQSVYCADPEKIELARDLETFCELYNSLNVRLNGVLLQGSPWTFNHFRGSFILKQKVYNGLYVLAPEPAFLQNVLHV